MGSVNGKVFSVMGPNNYQINLFGIFSGNDPVKNCRKFTESFFRWAMLVMTMVFVGSARNTVGKSTGPTWSKLVKGAFLCRQSTAKRRPTWPSWSKLAFLGPTWSKLVPYTLSHRTPRTPEFGFFFWGGECRFYFHGRRDFSELSRPSP